jgi:hypothetical protein
MLLCRDHWARLPARLQNDITAAWRQGRIDDWRAAGRRAVSWFDANPDTRLTPAPRWARFEATHPEPRP